EMGADVLSGLVDLYLQQSQSEVKLISDFIQKGDFESLRKTVHSLKGSSYNTGAQKMGDLCLAIEKSLKENDLQSLSNLANALPDVLDQTRQALDKLINSLA
ncbi:MAG: Hpt domain-containing protein, partial [Anaerolineae bacterium]|nr:Hpt domain-containing protein [Anaerolineae bacterium]